MSDPVPVDEVRVVVLVGVVVVSLVVVVLSLPELVPDELDEDDRELRPPDDCRTPVGASTVML